MVNIDIFPNEQAADGFARHYFLLNAHQRGRLEERLEQRVRQYKQETGFYKKHSREAQQRAGAFSIVDPEMIALKAEEYQKISQGAGADLSLYPLIDLFAFNPGNQKVFYGFSFGLDELGESSTDKSYKTITDLGAAVRKTTKSLHTQYGGMTIKPVFYTIEGTEIFPTAEMKVQAAESLDAAEIRNLDRGQYRIIRGMGKVSSRQWVFRGLTTEERDRFVR